MLCAFRTVTLSYSATWDGIVGQKYKMFRPGTAGMHCTALYCTAHPVSSLGSISRLKSILIVGDGTLQVAEEAASVDCIVRRSCSTQASYELPPEAFRNATKQRSSLCQSRRSNRHHRLYLLHDHCINGVLAVTTITITIVFICVLLIAVLTIICIFSRILICVCICHCQDNDTLDTYL